MEGKTPFIDCVETWIRTGNIEPSSRVYHWFWRDGYIFNKSFVLELEKRSFKRVVTLYRRYEDCMIKIDLTPEEVNRFWDLQDIAQIHIEKHKNKSNKEWLDKKERARWYP